MNFRKLITYLTMGTAAAMPLAVAQNPTILQGNYISNVFGNSNFVLNPNAQTNIANVTVSSATVTRSTTTPLVATSEFNITTSTSTGYADWSTRTFDAGMKNQNCEARFTYRGFSVGSTTAQIIQGASTVVAQLTLTASTDPRIASINFPCGDLSAATKFRLQQATASLTGTNEIGGIYVGLATNMANVAQAEMVGGIVFADNNNWTVTQTSYAADFAANGSIGTAFGNCTAPATAVPHVTCTIKPGEYEISASMFIETQQSNTAGNCRIYDGTTAITENQSGGYNTGTAAYTGRPNFFSGRVSYSTTQTVTFKLQCKSGGGIILALTGGGTRSGSMTIKRFPSSSELVVTPERQNVFASVKASAAAGTNSVTSSSWTKLTAASTLTRTNFGKAKVESNNDYSITIENMPVGNYYISTTGTFYTSAGASGAETICFFGLADSATGGAQIASMEVLATGDATAATQAIFGSTFGGVYNNSSVATRTFYVQGYRAGGTGSCNSYSDANRVLTITVIPLDQPSNSALYVQGPVQAAATGAAIPAGYLGQTQLCSGNRGFANNTNGAAGWSLNSSVSAGCTLTPGIYLVRWSFLLAATSGTSTGQKTAVLTTDSTDGWPPTSNLSQGNLAFGNGTLSGDDQRASTSIVTVTPSGISGGTGFVLYGKIYVATHTSFTGTYYFDATIVRLN